MLKTKRLITNDKDIEMMGKLGIFGKVFAFIVGGFIAIIVGCFMLRGTMHLWDKNDPVKDSNKLKQQDD